MSNDGRGEVSRSEAIEWMIALQDRPDDKALRSGFELWHRDPANAASWHELDRVSKRIGQAGLDHVAPRTPARARWKVVGPVAFAACLALLMVGGDLIIAVAADHVTDTGETRSLRLADGSRVTLAPRSAIVMADGTGGRHIRLLRGAAYFDVVHDETHPFRVTAGEAVATDLGTAFEVRRDGDVVHVGVREGLVRTSCESGWTDPIALRPGDTQMLDCTADLHPHGRRPPTAIASWTDGQMIVTDQPLFEVVAALQPWHSGVLLTRGQGRGRRVTGVYDLRHPERALAAIARAHRAEIIQVTPWIMIVNAD